VYPLLHSDQLRQAWLDDWIFQGVLDVEHLPSAASASASPATPAMPATPAESATGSAT
jgi:glycerol-3-phosphate dehydrogenase